MSAQPSDKEKSVSGSGDSEGFSEHLTGRSMPRGETDQSDSTDITELETPPTLSDETLQRDGDAAVIGEQNFQVEIESIFAQQQRESLAPQKMLNELRFTQLVESQEPEITKPVAVEEILMPTSGIGDGEGSLVRASEPGVDEGMLVPTAELRIGERIFMPTAEPGVGERIFMPTAEPGVDEQILVPSSEPGVDEQILVPSSELRVDEQTLVTVSELVVDEGMSVPAFENGDELAVTNTQLAAAIQNLIGGEKAIPNAVSQISATGSGLVKEPRVHGEKSTKLGSTPTGILQTPIAVKSTPEAKNPIAQQDTPVQPNIALSQERSSSPGADLEKNIQSPEVMTPSATVSIDSSVQKLSVDANFPSLSQPSQTLVRAIQENSNWTKVLSSSSIQVDQMPKIDGTVLQKLDIHLNLAALGKLDVKLRIQQGELQVQIRTDSEQTFKMLSVDQDVLENTIRGLGYKVDTIAISGPRSDGGFQMNNSSQMYGQQHSAEQQYQNEKSGQRADRDVVPKREADNETQSPSSDVEHGAADVDVI